MMCKKEFLEALRNGLTGIPQADVEERLTFYSEMIDDRIEDGVTEEAAVSEFGTVEEIVSQTLSEIPLAKLVKKKAKLHRSLRAWEIVLLVLGSPIWLSLLIAAFAIIVSLYSVVWSLILVLWATELALFACLLAGMISAANFLIQSNVVAGLAMLGAGLACAGIAIFGFFGCKLATRGVWLFTKKTVIGVKSCFIQKEAVK